MGTSAYNIHYFSSVHKVVHQKVHKVVVHKVVYQAFEPIEEQRAFTINPNAALSLMW